MAKTDYEIAVDDFLIADAAFQDAREKLTSGDLMLSIMEFTTASVPAASLTRDRFKEEWSKFIQHLEDLLVDRNAKRKSAADALRQAVQLTQTQWRGVDGKPTVLECGPFKVTSVTHREFHPEDLINLATKFEVLGQLNDLKAMDKKGNTLPAVREVTEVDYPTVLNWLKSNKLTKIIDGSYDEKEGTPQVKGPKEIVFFGEKKD